MKQSAAVNDVSWHGEWIMTEVSELSRCFFTGHRILNAHERERAFFVTCGLCEKLILTKGVTEFISGGALGYDYIAAKAVLRLREKYPVRLLIYLPCKNRDAKWNKHWRDEWNDMISLSDECRYITNGPYTDGCMQKRNRAMVDDAKYGIAFCRRQYGGTASTLRYAQKRGREFVVLTSPGDDIPFGMFNKKYI